MLTPIQRDVLAYIDAFQRRHNRSPSISMICDAMGYASKNTGHWIVSSLRRRGYLDGMTIIRWPSVSLWVWDDELKELVVPTALRPARGGAGR